MNKFEDIRGVAFDLDGTLVDSAPGLAAAVDMALYALELPVAGEERVIKVTAAQAGAVPVAGGTYTGPVTFQQGMLFDASGTTKLSFGPAGFYMQSGDTRIGLDASGAPVVGKVSTNTNSRIITDATFAEVK